MTHWNSGSRHQIVKQIELLRRQMENMVAFADGPPDWVQFNFPDRDRLGASASRSSTRRRAVLMRAANSGREGVLAMQFSEPPRVAAPSSCSWMLRAKIRGIRTASITRPSRRKRIVVGFVHATSSKPDMLKAFRRARDTPSSSSRLVMPRISPLRSPVAGGLISSIRAPTPNLCNRVPNRISLKTGPEKEIGITES